MMRLKKLKKKFKRLIPVAFVCTFCVAVAIKSVQSLVGVWQYYVQPLLQPTTVVCLTHNIYSEELIQSIKAMVQEYATNQLIVSFKPDVLYKKLKEQFKCIKSLSYELQAPKNIKVIIYGVEPKIIVNDQYVLGNKNRLFAVSDFQDFNVQMLPHVEIDDECCNQKLSSQVFEFVHKIPMNMWDRFKIIFSSVDAITLIPRQSPCPFKIITDTYSFFDEHKFKQVNTVFNDLVKKEKITQRMLASKECNVVFDIRFDNRVYVKFLNKSRRGGRL